MNNEINVINNTGEKFNVVINENKNKLEIIINTINPAFTLPDGLKPGDVFKDIDGEEWILWYYLENGDAAIIKMDNLPNDNCFGKNNNYTRSDIDIYLSDVYLKELERKFGKSNIVEHNVDLLSLDGEDDYGIIKRKVSIPTFNIYRKNKKTIKKYIKKPFLLATPNSTPSGYGSGYVQCVDSLGGVGCVDYDWYKGVRPFLILKSSNQKSTKQQ